MRFIKFKSQKGQSLVEMAITAPLLIFFLLGIFEVGSAIRGYLVLVNANREITRFAVRPGYLDFSTKADTHSSFERVRDWVSNSIADQLHLDFSDVDGNTTMIISHVVVDTGLPCEDIYSNPGNCDCDEFINNPTTYANIFDIDDLIIHPDIAGMEYQSESFGPDSTVTGPRPTQIDYDELIQTELIPQNNKFNCEIIKRGGVPSANNLVITELYYDQPQLFGFPLISNPFTDPVPLYTHTTMRLAAGARSNGTEAGSLTKNVDKTGPVCDAFPIIVHKDTIKYGTEEKIDKQVDIFDGNGGSDFGWLAWNPDNSVGSNSTPYLENSLKYSTVSLNDYTNARVPSDHSLSVDDYVASMQGDKAAVEASAGLLTALVGTEIRIPVWDTFSPGTGGLRDAYHIIGFAWVRIDYASDIDLPGKEIIATYLGDATESCPDPTTNNVPTATDDSASTPKNTPITINVLSNDSDLDGDSLTIIQVDEISSPFKGTIDITDGGTTGTYTPHTNDTGTYIFSYTIHDGKGGIDVAEVTVTVTP